MSKIVTVGFDLAKNVFQAHGADAAGRAILAQQAAANAGAGVPRATELMRWMPPRNGISYAMMVA
jgi:hypothetical protein